MITGTSFATANSIFVLSSGVVTFDGETFTFIDTPPPANKDLVTCTGEGADFSISLAGFFTPAP